jgi:hypothetical protein
VHLKPVAACLLFASSQIPLCCSLFTLRWLLLLVNARNYSMLQVALARASEFNFCVLSGAVKKKADAEQAALMAADIATYEVGGDEASWTEALQMSGAVPSIISVKAAAGKSKRQLEQESFAAGDF